MGMSLESAWRPLRTFLRKRTPWPRVPGADSGILIRENALACERRKGKLHPVKTGVQELGESYMWEMRGPAICISHSHILHINFNSY
jgi:hypothetical protein